MKRVQISECSVDFQRPLAILKLLPEHFPLTSFLFPLPHYLEMADIPCLRAVTHRQAVRHSNLRNQELEDHDQGFGTSIQKPSASPRLRVSA